MNLFTMHRFDLFRHLTLGTKDPYENQDTNDHQKPLTTKNPMTPRPLWPPNSLVKDNKKFDDFNIAGY